MRVVECNICGEALAAATDDELVRRLQGHHQEEHEDVPLDDSAVRDTIAREAYEASDS
jgi:predicted small metal-binding protein